MKSKKLGKIYLLSFVALLVLGAGTSLLFVNGPLGEVFFQNQNFQAAVELVLIFVWMWVSLCLVQNPKLSAGLAVVGGAAAAWCHMALIPLIVSGVYGCFLLLLGKRALKCGGMSGSELERYGWPVWAVMGAAVWICLVCLVSAFGFGGISLWRAAAAGLAVCLVIWEGIDSRKSDRRHRFPIGKRMLTRRQGLALAIILTCFLLQAARMNIALDYDSLHYGLRSPYILDNGNGIYENLGNINIVYTYAKGLEILVLPLSGTATYGFVLSFTVWTTGAIVCLIYRIGKRLGGTGCGWLAAVVVSLIPGIMNMAITAKTDSITLFFQLIMLDCILGGLESTTEEGTLREMQGKRTGWLAAIAGACMVSYTFKPTAIVFSTALAGVAILCLFRGKPVFRKGVVRLLTIPTLAWAGTWIRTYLLTGMPSTSVFTSIWELLGFQVRWPFAFSAIPNEGISMGFFGGLAHLGGRLMKMLFAPLGEDMDHVIIAWGTGLLLLCLLTAVLYGKSAVNRGNETEKRQRKFLYLALGAVTVLSIVSIYLLWQVDGNYFMLWYALAVLGGSTALTKGRVPSGREAVEGKPMLGCWIRGLAALLVVFQVAVMLLTSWAGGVGFTPVSLIHRGYYDHRAQARTRADENGRGQIWEFLSADPSNRVIAFGEHPECLDFACNVQSYYDVTGSGGNVVLVKTLNNFKDFLRYAGIQYIYAEAGHLEEGTREWDVLRYLVEDGSLTDIRYENGSLVGSVDLDGGSDEQKIAAQTEEFYRNVILR